MNQISEKVKVKRVPKRGYYDKATIHQVLDRHYVCHIGFEHEGFPVVIPTLYGRDGDWLYIHGASSSRMMKNLSQGIAICLTVTRVNGLVLARSAFHHSMNYESAVVFGKAVEVEENEKTQALKVISEQIIPHRWEEVRKPNSKELKATLVLKVKIEEASAKIRTGGPVDEKEDQSLDIWAGELPFTQQYADPIPDMSGKTSSDLPASVKLFYNKF